MIMPLLLLRRNFIHQVWYQQFRNMQSDSYQQRLKARDLISKQLKLCSNQDFQGLKKELMEYFKKQEKDIIYLQDILTREFQEYIRFPIKHEFLCAKELQIDKKDKKRKGYTCLKCRTEVNSIICQGCFDQKKHQGHPVKPVDYEPHIVCTCDCGDTSKWSQDGFCEGHQFTAEEDQLQEGEGQSFKDKLVYLFNVFYAMHLLLLKTRELHVVIEKQVNDKLNGFGNCLMEKLLQWNKNRMYINRLTYNVLMERINIKINENGLESTILVLDFLFSFKQQQNQALASKCVNLFILLFYRNQTFRQLMTIKYISNYSTMVRTKYRDLSCYLLSNSLMIAELARFGRLGKFILDKKMSRHEQSNIGEKVKETIQAHIDYHTDNFYFTELTQHGTAAYWRYFNNIDGFLEIGNYCESFTNEQQFDIINQEHYRIQYWFISRMTRILDFMFSLNDQNFFQRLIRKLFDKITKEQPQKTIKNNLFFTYERLWALSVYLFLLRQDKNTFIPSKPESKTQYNEQLVMLYRNLNLPNSEQANKKFAFLLRKIVNYVELTSPLSTKKPDVIKNQHKTDFVVYYYGNNNFLFSIDAIFYQIVIKLMVYIQNKASKQQENKKKVTRVDLNDVYKKTTTKTETKHPYIGIDQILNQSLKDAGLKIISNLGEKDEVKLIKAANETRYLLSFIGQLLQMHYSQVPDLQIAARFAKVRSREYYRQKYMQYYYNLLASINDKVARIDKKDFIEIVKRLLFEEYQVLRQFLDTSNKNAPFLLKRNAMNKGKKVDLYSHMSSLKRRISNSAIISYYEVDQVNASPFLYQTQHLSYHLISTDVFHLMGGILAVSYKLGLTVNIKDWKCLFYDLTRQMWKLSYYSGGKQFHKFFTQMHHIQQNIASYQSKCKVLNFLSDFFQQQIANYLNQRRLVEQYIYERYFEEQSFQHQVSNNLDQSMQISLRKYEDYKKQEESFTSSQQFSSIIPQQNYCSANKCPIQCNEEDVHQLCFAHYTFVPDFFSLNPKMKVIYFSSCQHYFHKTCLFSLKCFPQNGNQYKCPVQKCKSRFNFLLVSQNQLNDNDPVKIAQSIFYMFESICKAIFSKKRVNPSQVERFYPQIVKSIIVYILIASTTSKSYIKKMNIQLITYLLKILQRYIQKREKDYSQRFTDIFKFMEKQRSYELLSYLKEVIGNKIMAYAGFDPSKVNEAYISKEQAQVIDIFFQRTFRKFKQNSSFSDKSYMANVNKLTQQREYFKCLYPPKDLLQLSKLNGKCCCEQNTQKCTRISLLFRKGHDLDYSCFSCENIFIRKHLENHDNELLVINIDTGFIIYYAHINKEYWTLPIGHIYKDATLRGFSAHLGPQYFQNPQNKKFFQLRSSQYEQILFKFHSKAYLISGAFEPLNFDEK